MTSPNSWLRPTLFATDDNPLNLIIVPVTLLVSQIATYICRILKHSCYLANGVTFSTLSTWISLYDEITASTTDHKNTSIPTKSSSGDEHKVPTFCVPKFTGDTLTGDTYIDSVDNAFRSSTITKYLLDEVCCMKNPEWSDAFASRLRESICESDILGFLSTELKAEKHCAKVWKQIMSHLTSADRNTARMMALWNQLFNLKCEDNDCFLSFHSTNKRFDSKIKKE